MKLRTLMKAAGLFVAFVALGTSAQAQLPPNAVTLSGTLSTGRTLFADSVYFVSGVYKVLSGGVLTIQPGTLIMGNGSPTDTSNKCAIQVQPGGQIFANGTRNAPIILTSSRTQGSRGAGQGPAILLLGNAAINPSGGTATIEGGTGATYGGGASPNDADNSGTLRYTRVEFAGSIFSPNNEINGITFGGVGSGTTIDYCQVSYSLDDSYEWFGGMVNVSHLVAFCGIDDDFDTDFGFRGIGQYMFSIRDVNISDNGAGGSGSNGLEADNDASGSGNTPLSQPKFANVTLVGPFYDGTAPGSSLFLQEALWRRNTNYQLYNSILTGWATGLNVAGNSTASDGVGNDDKLRLSPCPQPSILEIKGTIVAAATNVQNPSAATTLTDQTNWFNCAGAGNNSSATYTYPALIAVGQADLSNPDPRPATTSPAATGGVTLAASFGGRTSTAYRGAFDPSLSREQQWDYAWTNYNPKLTSYIKHRRGWAMVGLANTPSGTNNQKDSIYTFGHSGNAFKFNPATGYSTENGLVATRGYFLFLDSNATVEQTGATVALPVTTASLGAGWQMVSTGASSAATAATTQLNGGALPPGTTFFGFDPVSGYQAATILEPGKAYFVLLPSGGGTLTFNP